MDEKKKIIRCPINTRNRLFSDITRAMLLTVDVSYVPHVVKHPTGPPVGQSRSSYLNRNGWWGSNAPKSITKRRGAR